MKLSISRLFPLWAIVGLIAACGGGGGGASGTPTASPPTAPSNLAATTVSTSVVNLSWMDNSSTEDGFKVEQSSSSASGFTEVGTVGVGITNFAATSLVPSTTYYFRVRAYNNSLGNSSYSNTANATTQAAPVFDTPSGYVKVSSNQESPAVAFGSVSNIWAVCYSSGSTITRQVLDANGVLVGTATQISTSTHANPRECAIAYASSSDKFLACWSDGSGYDSQVYGRLLDGSGAPLGSGDFEISTGAYQGKPAVTWDPVGQRFLVVWENWANYTTPITGRLLDTSGAFAGNPFPISSGSWQASAPAVSCNTTDGSFLVVWADARNQSPTRTYGQVIVSSGTLSGSNVLIAAQASIHQMAHSIAFSSQLGKYLVAWDERRTSNQNSLGVSGVIVAADGNPSASPFLIASPAGQNQMWPSLDYDAGHSRFLAMFEISGDIYVQAFDPAGALLGNVVRVCDRSNNQYYPRPSMNNAASKFLAVWMDYSSDPPGSGILSRIVPIVR